jgi:hypothetical protein
LSSDFIDQEAAPEEAAEAASTGEKAPPCHVDAVRFIALIEALVDAAGKLDPAPDSIVGIKRSGLFPAVVLSHKLALPFFTATEAKYFPYPRLQWPLIIDTVAWTGETIRRCQHRLDRAGVPVERLRVLVMFARREPVPPVPNLSWVETTQRIPLFWYAEPRVGSNGERLAGGEGLPGAGRGWT